MRFTKLGHSCVRLEKDGAHLVIDPGVWSGTDPLAGANALLITHEHVDHINSDVVRAALEADAGLELWTTGAVAEQFAGFGGRVHAVGHGDAFTAAGFDVHVYGRDHAPIYPGMPVVANVGFAIDGNVFHPGDAFTVPDEPARTLRSREHGGVLRTWNHTLHAEPAGDQRCRYSDTVDIDAGPLTGFIATLAIWVFQYRQRRWHKLVRNHLRPSGPRYATKARSEPA